MLWLFVTPTKVYLLDFFCSGIQFYLLLSPNLCFVSFYTLIYKLNRGSNMCVHVLLNLLNELRKRDKMRCLSSIFFLFCNQFNKFNNTGA